MIKIPLPRFDVNDVEGEVKEIYVRTGDHVQEGTPLLEVETTKAVETILSPAEGYVQILVEKGQRYPFGYTLALIFETESALQHHLEKQRQEQTEVPPVSNQEVRATKKAVEKARELGVDLKEIQKEGVIMEEDVIAFHSARTTAIPRPTPRFRYDLERVVIIGAGRGADVVLDILMDDPDKLVVGFVDDQAQSYPLLDLPVLFHSVREFPQHFDRQAYDSVIISFGANLKTMRLRDEIFRLYREHDVPFTNAIAASAELRRGVKLGQGNIIGGGVYIGTLTQIGDNNLIAYGAAIGHHNQIGNSNLIAPGVITSGSVRIGSLCIVSAGTTFVNRVSIGDRVVLPLGYRVVRDIPSDTVIKTGT